MIRQRKIELLAPAKNLECGIAAVDHGADAIYIGAPRFGARAAAGNSLEDIAELVRYAHVYNVRIYVTVNTILKDEELKDTEKMIWDLYRAGVDALKTGSTSTNGSCCNISESEVTSKLLFNV
jgi:23S rRNA 5-hydroxycytidine C2501 synthase